MKTMARQIVNPQLGMDLSIPASPNTAQLIENFRYDAQTKGWTTHLGFEPYFHTDPGNGPFTHLGIFNKPVDSLYVFQKHGSKQQNILYECAGRLCLLAPYRDTASTQRIILDQTRTVPTPNAVRTSYEPYGKYCIITNGIDEPVKFRADGRLYPLGWAEAPGDPTVSAVRVPDSSGDITALEATDSYVGSGSNIYQGDDSTFEGVSSSTDTVTVEYIYRVSFVNENGSESPLSNNSNKFVYKGASVTRDGNSGVPKVLAVLSLATGPVGTVARRIYRTQSDGDQSLFYFVEEVKNNRDTSYTDYRSDKSLGAQAPNRSDSIRFPAKSTRFTASFKNCLFVDGGEMDPTRLYFSRPLEPDRFAAGGLDGGSDLVLKKLSQGLDEVFERLSIDAMPAAVGAFSPSMQELHYYMPVSGQTNLRLGLVFHTNNGQFTQRVGFPIRCITTDKDGNFLFGCDEYSPASTPGNNVPIRRGIYAISAKRAAGTQGSASADVPKEADPLPFVFRSQWIDMGLPYLKKYPKYLYLYVMTTGDMEVKVDHFIDRNWQEPNDGGTAIMQPPDHIDQPVYDKAKFDQVIWQDKRMTEVRVPITCGACSSYAFEISGIENFIFIGYSVEYQVDGAMTIKGKRSS